MLAHNVRDGRRGYIGAWVDEPLVYAKLAPDDIGRTVIYQDFGRAGRFFMAKYDHPEAFALMWYACNCGH